MYATTAEFAKLMKVSADKVRDWINSGKLFAINVASDDTPRPQWRIPIDSQNLNEFRANMRSNADSVAPQPVKKKQSTAPRRYS